MTNMFDDMITEISTNEKNETSFIKTEEEKIFTVSEFSNILKSLLEEGFYKIKIKGEIQGLKKHSSGTYYFDLKESFAGKDYILNSVLWKWTKTEVKLEEGLEVIITGKITAYTGRSSYQITVENIEISGVGTLLKIIEERKQKLLNEGLFNPEHKKKIPLFPKKIAVVTSPTGSVIQDIIHRIKERFPTNILVFPVAVQGEGADIQISSTIDNINKLKNKPDLIIVARGGGSIQDLMPFNEENVVRSVFNSEIPIISAVGHETDTTLIDYVSDLRAPTPTAAAEKATPVKSEILLKLNEKENILTKTILNMFENIKLKIQSTSNKLKNPSQLVNEFMQRLDDKTSKLELIIKNKLENFENKISFSSKMLESYSFKNVLKRGFTIIKNKDEIITNINGLKSKDCATIEFYDGEVDVYTSKPSNKKEKSPSNGPIKNSQGDLF